MFRQTLKCSKYKTSTMEKSANESDTVLNNLNAEVQEAA